MTHQIPGDAYGHGRPGVDKAAMLHAHLPDSSLYVTCYLHFLVLARVTMPGFNVEAWDLNSGPHI